jgi:predicted lipoprotein with Yx(FWY)xxD motif
VAANLSSRVLFAFACVAATVGVAACGSSDDTTTSTTSAPATSGAATVDLSDSAGLGQILVDGSGRTLYLFEKDDEGDESYCSGDCAKDWPPFTTKGEPQAGDGIDAAKLTTFKREDGTTQVAYDDHPLYYFSEDTAAGEANGNGLDEFGAEWYALDASGQTAEGDEESEGSTDSTSTDSGYSY